MEYMIINNSAETDTPAPGSPEFEALMGRWMAYNKMLIENGHWVSGASLAPSNTATTVLKVEGRATVLDGPFAETKEQIGGYYLIEAADLDKAIELATAMPIDTCSMEVRPVAFRPDASSDS
ncbi:MAG: YciI family protein [Acidimicrobiales bacterium]